MFTGKRLVLSAVTAAAAVCCIGVGAAHADTEPAPTPEPAPAACPANNCDPDAISGSDPAPSDPGPVPEPAVVDDPIPGDAPSRPLALVPTASIHPVTAAAAITKSAIVYTAHPANTVTDADIDSGLLAAGTDPSVEPRFAAATRTIMRGESGGAINAVNRKDSNAHGVSLADGAPAGSSRGLMQTVPATFAAHHVSGTSTYIYDPAANIAAAWDYIASVYHVDLHTGAGLSEFMARGVGRGVGY